MLYDSGYMTFQERQHYRERMEISVWGRWCGAVTTGKEFLVDFGDNLYLPPPDGSTPDDIHLTGLRVHLKIVTAIACKLHCDKAG